MMRNRVMKKNLSLYEQVRNQHFNELLLLRDFKQNKNDYIHRNKYDKFIYKLVISVSEREKYSKNFIELNYLVKNKSNE